VADNLRDHELLAGRDRRGLGRLTEALAGRPFAHVPHLAADVHDLRGLARIAGHLFSSGE
jgi:hypothetical protein